MNNNTQTKHIFSYSSQSGGVNWIDWMKTIGMYFIIWGHLSPNILKSFIYAFSVPSFFMISGYLFKASDWTSFFKKNFKGIIVPYFLLGFSVVLFFAVVKLYFGGYEKDYFPLSIFALLIGNQNGIGLGIGSQALWFVYTLFLLKVLCNCLRTNYKAQTATALLCLVAAYVLDKNGLNLYSSWANVLLAYPFFYVGFLLKNRFGTSINDFSIKRNNKYSIISLLIIGSCLLYALANINDLIEMYNAKFGNNLFLFIVDGFIGTFLLAICSILCGNKDKLGIVNNLSKGTIIVLAWQIVFLLMIDLTMSRILGCYLHNDVVTFIIACVIYIVFIPIIKFIRLHLPLLVGYRR